MEMALQTKGLTKKYGNKKVVNQVSLNVPQNCVYGLLGPNGAGKSTLLKMIMGITKPNAGSMTFENHEWSRNDLNNMGALIETPPIYGNLSAYDNLKVRTLTLGIGEGEINDVLHRMGLNDVGNKKAGRFSLGMKQRLGIALAIINHPKLLILDEPTNGLDPLGIEELRSMIRDFTRQGITVVLSSHILGEVQMIADYIGIIADGTLAYEGKMDSQANLEELFINIVKVWL